MSTAESHGRGTRGSGQGQYFWFRWVTGYNFGKRHHSRNPTISIREAVPLEGELNCWTRGFDIPDVILKVCETGRTGLLRFVNAEAEKTLFVSAGAIIFAKSSSLDDRLGEYLLRRGQISISNLMKLAQEVRPGRRLGTVLVENHILEAKELVQAVIGQVRAIILSLFRWTEAWYGFEEMELPNETITLSMPTSQLIIDGIRLIDSWRRIQQGVGALSSCYRQVPGIGDKLATLPLDAPARELLALLDSPHRVEQLCATSPLPDLIVCRYVWVFRCLDWIEHAKPEDMLDAVDAPAAVAVKEVTQLESPVVPGPPRAEVEAAADVNRVDAATATPPESGPSPSGASAPAVGEARATANPAEARGASLGVVNGQAAVNGETPRVVVGAESPIELSDPSPGPVIEAVEDEESSLEEVAPTPVLEGQLVAPVVEVPDDEAGVEELTEKAAPELESEDMDMEGLEMVLGESDPDPQT